MILAPRRTGGYQEIRAAQGIGHPQYGTLTVEARQQCIDIALCYRRCIDFDATNSAGQDAAGVRADSAFVVAVVADGVAQSFFGNLAADHLCDCLLTLLWNRRMDPPNSDQLTTELRAQEAILAPAIAAYSLDHLHGLVRSGLEKTRARGSQAVFAATLWNLDSGRVDVYQVGDIALLLYKDAPESETIGAPPNGRWSTNGATDLQLQYTVFDRPSGIVMKSDGASADWGATNNSEALSPAAFERMAEARASIDDVSAISIFHRARSSSATHPDARPTRALYPPTRITPAPSTRPPVIPIPVPQLTPPVVRPTLERRRPRPGLLFAVGVAVGVLIGTAAWTWRVGQGPSSDLRMQTARARRFLSRVRGTTPPAAEIAVKPQGALTLPTRTLPGLAQVGLVVAPPRGTMVERTPEPPPPPRKH